MNYAGGARERGRFSNLTRSNKQGLRITVPSLWGTLPIEMPSKAMTLLMNLVNKILILKTDWILKKEIALSCLELNLSNSIEILVFVLKRRRNLRNTPGILVRLPRWFQK